jgi:NADH dehydrogenase [ubiquinone] 1 alpha subcomplex assembly factor 5
MQIFDRARVKRNLHSAQDRFSGHDFLWRHTGNQLQDRLLDIKRDFANASEISIAPYVLTPEFLQRKKMGDVFHVAPLAGSGLVINDEFLPFAPQSLETIISNNHLHWVNDVPGVLAQMRHALKPDGLLLGSFFGGETLSELRHCVMRAESELLGGISPRISPFISLQDMAALMQRAQFALPVVDHEMITVTYENLQKLLHDLRGMGQGNAIAKRDHKILPKIFWPTVEKIYRDNFMNNAGRLQVTVEIIYFLGWAPADSQPQPLKRGSATHRLVDVLKN